MHMRLLLNRVSFALLACGLVAMALAMPASAAITSTAITTPGTSPLYSMYNADTPSTFAVAGTTDSTTPATDKVDLRCFYGSPAVSILVQAGVSLTGTGAFSVPTASLAAINSRGCRLRAVPAGSTSNSNSYRGPLMLTGYQSTNKITGGPNNGTAYDFYVREPQVSAAADYRSIGGGGWWDQILVNQAYGFDADVFYANAFLWGGNMDGTADTASDIKVDGQNAYDSSGANSRFARSGSCPPTCDGSRDNAGFPPLTYSVAQNTTTGDVTVHESENLVRCPPGIAYPPTHATCPSFTSTGVKVDRTIVQDHDGHLGLVSDNFSSTDGQQHAIDLLYDNDQYLGNSRQPNIGYLFPGQSAYAVHVRGDTVTVPARPASILVKNPSADDGDPNTGQGAITYSVAPSQIMFVSPSNYGSSDFTMHYTGTVPATGALTYKFGYSVEYTTAAVTADALEVLHSFTPCVVPKVKNKTLSQAKAALKKAYCALGKVTKAKSKTVKKGRVISSKPAAGVTKPFGTLVNLKVSKGKR